MTSAREGSTSPPAPRPRSSSTTPGQGQAHPTEPPANEAELFEPGLARKRTSAGSCCPPHHTPRSSRWPITSIRDLLGLDQAATLQELLGHLGDLLRQLAVARVLNDSLRAEIEATHVEQAHDPAQVSLFSEPDPAQQRRPRLALVPVEDPPLELAGEAIVAALAWLPGVEMVSVDQLQSDTSVFMVSIRGGDDQDVASAILRTFPQGTVQTAGTTKVVVGDQAVWLCRPRLGE